MKSRLLHAAALLALLAAAGCKRKAPPPAPPPVAIAVVNGTRVPLSALQREVDRLRSEGKGAPDGGAGEGEAPAQTDDPKESRDPVRLGRALLSPLLDRVLLVQRARASGMAVSDAEVEQAMDSLSEAAKAAGESFEARLQQDGQTLEELREDTRERLLAAKFVTDQVRGERPSPTEVRAWYDQHHAELDTPEEVHALQIVVATAGEAKSLLDQLRNGGSFEDLARAHSTSPDGRRGGDLGWFGKGTMPAIFDEVCFSLKPGQLSGVVPSRYGFHLFKLLARKPARRRPFEEVQSEVERRAAAEKRIQAERLLLTLARKGADIQINEAALAQLR